MLSSCGEARACLSPDTNCLTQRLHRTPSLIFRLVIFEDAYNKLEAIYSGNITSIGAPANSPWELRNLNTLYCWKLKNSLFERNFAHWCLLCQKILIFSFILWLWKGINHLCMKSKQTHTQRINYILFNPACRAIEALRVLLFRSTNE